MQKLWSIFLLVIFLNLIGGDAVIANHMSSQEETLTIQRAIKGYGLGKGTTIEVRLKNGEKLKGFVEDFGAESFVLVHAKSGKKSIIYYRDVKKVASGKLSKGKKIVIGVAATASGVLLTWLFLLTRD